MDLRADRVAQRLGDCARTGPPSCRAYANLSALPVRPPQSNVMSPPEASRTLRGTFANNAGRDTNRGSARRNVL